MFGFDKHIFAALADPTRQEIVEMLAKKGQLTATAIYSVFPISNPAISQHLKVLRDADIVTVEKKAQQRIYQINSQKMIELESYLHQLTHQWDKRLDRLDRVVRKEVKIHGRTK